mgnify:CR=1 FL=1
MTQMIFPKWEYNYLLQKKEFSFIVFIIILSFSSIFGQTVKSITPNSGTQGESALSVSIIIEAGTMPLPPADVPVQSVTIGSISGTSLSHVSETEITAVFNIPSDATAGAY